MRKCICLLEWCTEVQIATYMSPAIKYWCLLACCECVTGVCLHICTSAQISHCFGSSLWYLSADERDAPTMLVIMHTLKNFGWSYEPSQGGAHTDTSLLLLEMFGLPSWDLFRNSLLMTLAKFLLKPSNVSCLLLPKRWIVAYLHSSEKICQKLLPDLMWQNQKMLAYFHPKQ